MAILEKNSSNGGTQVYTFWVFSAFIQDFTIRGEAGYQPSSNMCGEWRNTIRG